MKPDPEPSPRSPEVGQLRVLHIEDSEADAAFIVRELRRGGYDLQYERVETASAMEAAIARQDWDVVLADWAMPFFSGQAALAALSSSGLDLPVIIVSGQIGEDVAVAAMRAGAHDFIIKGNWARLVPAVKRELRNAVSRRERKRAALAQQEEAEVSGALARMGRDLIASLASPLLLDRLCQLTTKALACDFSTTLLWRPDEDVYVPMATSNDTPEQWEATRLLRLPKALFTGVLAQLQHDDIVQVPLLESPHPLVPQLANQLNVSVLLYIALRRGGEPVGLQLAGYRDPEASFGLVQERIARGIAHLASLALEHARTVEELAHANRLKADFVATMSHELRTPLNIIIGYNDLLADREFGPLTDAQAEAVLRIQKSARDLFELIDATLDLSRLEAGKAPLNVTEIDVSELMREVLEDAQGRWDTSNLTLTSYADAELPRLRSDRLKLRVVLKSLVHNAVKFTAKGSVSIAAHRRAEGIEIAVRDCGIGIAPDIIPIIFEPFRQGESAMTRRYGGVGLGLYIVRRLLDLLSGTVSVESHERIGSTFRVWLPLRVSD